MAEQQQPQPGMQAMQYRFILEDPGSAASDNTKPRNPEQIGAIRATKAAGGACFFCKLRKKGCNSPRPCNECSKNSLPCMKNTSLCFAVPTKNRSKSRLLDEIFRRARDTLDHFRSGYSKELLEGNGTVSVQWEVPGGVNTSTWSEELDRLHRARVDDTVSNQLVEIALKTISIPQLEQAGHLEPLYDDPLYKDAYMMFKLFAAIETTSRSLLTIQLEHRFSSRFVIFLMLTVYAIKICEISMSFVSHLDTAIQDNRLGEEQVQWAVEIYSRLIKRLASFKKPESFLSDLFCQIRPRLDDIQDSIDKILPTSNREQNIVFPTLSEVEPFQITIRITSNRTPWASSVFSYRVDRLLHRGFFLPPDADTGATNPGFHMNGDTIDPRVLLLSPVFEGSSTRMTTAGPDYGFSAPGDSQETDITPVDGYDIAPSIHSEHNTSWTMFDAHQDLFEDLLCFGGQFY